MNQDEQREKILHITYETRTPEIRRGQLLIRIC
jgi:hypothetical protein